MTTTIRGTDNSAAAPALTGNDSDTGIYFPAADTLGLVTGGSEAVRVDSSGNVGIGTNSPNTYAGDTTLTINGSSGGGEIDFESAGTLKSYIYGSASALNFVTTTSIPLVFATNSTEAARFNSSGNLVFPNGQGIDFSASAGGGATSSLLDDYEEGSWTPVLTAAVTNPTYTASVAQGYYTKIGNICQFSVWLTVNITNAGSGTAYISLPFASTNTYTAVTITHETISTQDTENGYIVDSNSYFVLTLEDATNNASFTTGNPLYLMASGVYRVA